MSTQQTIFDSATKTTIAYGRTKTYVSSSIGFCIGLIFIIVYVGAIAVLFLFVIMMLNVKIHENIFSKLFSKNFRNTIIALFFVYLVYLSFPIKSFILKN